MYSQENLKMEWTEISQCLDPDSSHSVAVPHRFLESIHVYTLANILRRPIIIMTDPTIRTFSGMSLQDNDMGGIYLPLEWSWKDTHRTPILIGYSNNHFCPLLFADHPNQAMAGTTQKDLAPLVNEQLGQLPVRFLLEGEEPEVGELLRKYLKVRETVMQINENVQNILCTELETCNLPGELNLVQDYIQDCLRGYERAYQQLHNQAALASQFGAVRQEHLQQSARPVLFNRLSGSPQHVVREQLQRMQINEYGLGDPALSTANAVGQSPVHIPPPSFTPLLSLTRQNLSLNPPEEKKCVVPSCKYYGDEALGMMCSNCFKNYTIKESCQMAAARAYRPQPTAPLASMPAEEEHFQMSMMSERCKEGCGFRCSTKTYPYCHECAEKRQRKAQKKAAATASGSSSAPFVVTGFLNEASNAMGSAALPATPVPQKGQGVVASTQPVDLNTAQATSSASPLSMASAGSAVPQECQTQSGAAAPLPAGETSAEAMSPTQALATANLSAPLTPPDDTNDLLLFGSGQPVPVSPSQVGGTASPTQPQPQSPPASPGQTAASAEPFATESNTPVPEQSSRQTLSSLPDTQQQQQQPTAVSQVHGQNLLSSAAGLAESHLASVITGDTVGEPTQRCNTAGCRETAVFKNLCGQCYVGQGMDVAGPGHAALQKSKMMSKMMSMASSSSSAPASIGPVANQPKPSELGASLPPENKNRASSLPHLPNDVTLTNSKVYNWMEANSKVPESKGRKEGMMVSAQSSPLVGLPEKQESEQLGGSDLLASGEGCYSSTQRCIGEGCGNTVLEEGKLCQQCRDILRQARQGQGACSSVQGELI